MSKQEQKQEHENLLDSFGEMLSKLEPETTEANLKLEEHGGVTPFFTDSQVEGTTHPLTKLLRLLFKRYDISEEKFQWYHKQYCQATMMAPSKASSSRNNLKRSLQSDTITWETLERWMAVMGLSLVDMQLTVKDNTDGQVHTIKTSEIQSRLYHEARDAKLVREDIF